MLGDDHPDTLTARGTLAKLTGLQGRWHEDEQLCRELLPLHHGPGNCGS